MTVASAAADQERHRTPKWTKVLLIASLALNLLLIGAAIGSHFVMRRGGPWAGNIGASMIGFAGDLPSERRREIWRATGEHRKGLLPYWREVGRARREAIDVLRSTPFDAAKFTAAQQHLQDAEMRARTASQPMITAIAQSLTEDERKRLTSNHEERRRSRGQKRNWLSEMESEQPDRGPASGSGQPGAEQGQTKP